MKPLDGKIRVLLANCLLEMNREANEVLELSWSEICVISAIGMCDQNNHPCNASTISQMTGIPRTTASRVIGRMVEQEWISKIEHNSHPLYARTSDENKQALVSTFITRFESTLLTTADRIRESLP